MLHGANENATTKTGVTALTLATVMVSVVHKHTCLPTKQFHLFKGKTCTHCLLLYLVPYIPEVASLVRGSLPEQSFRSSADILFMCTLIL